jgi:hypothetical protein
MMRAVNTKVKEPDKKTIGKPGSLKSLLWIIVPVKIAIIAAAALFFFVSYVMDRDPRRYEDEVEHFKYGSIGAEVDGYPFVVWQTLPTLFPEKMTRGWASFGFSSEPGKLLPVGVSVRKYGVPRVGLNCAACHTSTVDGGEHVILGAPANKLNLEAYLKFLIESADDPRFTPDNIISEATRSQRISWLDGIVYRYYIIPKLRTTLARVAADNRWRESRPPHGPGRTDAGNPWRLHFRMHPENDRMVGTVDFPSLWNQDIRKRSWLHWDGNNSSLQERNLSAALAGGASEESLDHPSIERVAKWSLTAPPPEYPFEIDPHLAGEGKAIYLAQCASCHAADGGLYGRTTPVDQLGTDKQRLELFSDELLERFATVGAGKPWQFRHYRKSDGYANTALDGIWARAPYLHNGSVPTLFDLLAAPDDRPKQFYRGCDAFDRAKVGFVCNDGFLFATTEVGNGNGGHLYGTDLTMAERRALIEYLKTE